MSGAGFRTGVSGPATARGEFQVATMPRLHTQNLQRSCVLTAKSMPRTGNSMQLDAENTQLRYCPRVLTCAVLQRQSVLRCCPVVLACAALQYRPKSNARNHMHGTNSTEKAVSCIGSRGAGTAA
eukprot:3935981-Rhodomonas_salina.1